MDLLKGMEKYGLKTDEMEIYENKSKQSEEVIPQEVIEETAEHIEEALLLKKKVVCPVCGTTFETYRVKSGKVKRLEPDKDLRPRHQGIDTLKYDVTSCPKCGYTAMNRYYDNVTKTQSRLIIDQVVKNYTPSKDATVKLLTYPETIDRYKLALYNSIVKKGTASEKAFTCLKIAWMMRAMMADMTPQTPAEKKEFQAIGRDEIKFYNESYEGFVRAIAEEDYPMCGMDQYVVDYLIATLALRLGKAEVASKFISGILSSPTANRRMKDKALDIKAEIIEQLKKNKLAK